MSSRLLRGRVSLPASWPMRMERLKCADSETGQVMWSSRLLPDSIGCASVCHPRLTDGAAVGAERGRANLRKEVRPPTCHFCELQLELMGVAVRHGGCLTTESTEAVLRRALKFTEGGGGLRPNTKGRESPSGHERRGGWLSPAESAEVAERWGIVMSASDE